MSNIRYTVAPPGQFPPDTFAAEHRRDLYVTVVHASGSDATLAMASVTVLQSLGADTTVAGGKDHVADNTRWVPLWLLAHQVGWLVITDPHIWPVRALLDLLRIVAATSTRVLLALREHTTDELGGLLEGFAAEQVDWDTAPALLRADAPTPPTPPGPPDGPTGGASRIETVTSDWYRYRADCAALLPADHFTELDEHYRHGFDRTRHWITANGPEPDAEDVGDLLAELVVTAPGQPHALTRVRAAQAAFFTAGFNLRISATRLLTMLGTAATLGFTRSDWEAVRGYRQPERGAIIALHQTGLSTDAVMAVTVAEAADALHTGHLGPHHLPPDAAPFITAHLLDRALDGATGDDPFIDAAPNRATIVINRAARDLGLLIGARHAAANSNTAMFWQFRTGFLLETL